MTTRAEFLERIRNEVRRTAGLRSATPATRPAPPAETVDIIRRQLRERWPETLARFCREFERVGGVVHRVATVADIPGTVARVTRERGGSRLVSWDAAAIGTDLGPGLEREGLDLITPAPADGGDVERRRLRDAAATAAVGVTGVDLAIAETGTLVLRSGPGRPRATSLLPPTHVAVFGPAALIESLEQLGAFLTAWHVEDAGWGTMINLITGPSRTADIELTLTRGVHGPSEVHAVFVEAGLDA